ncbi:hypothetical protein HK098_003073 [Nowakowskiella sp. JEL0407]|nr:hypothetical protein HK098_003073 [Nowakowskiella sp. JEL0407]
MSSFVFNTAHSVQQMLTTEPVETRRRSTSASSHETSNSQYISFQSMNSPSSPSINSTQQSPFLSVSPVLRNTSSVSLSSLWSGNSQNLPSDNKNGVFGVLRAISAGTKIKKKSTGNDSPVMAYVLPPEGEDARIVEGVAGNGAILIQGRLEIKNIYHHPIPISVRNIRLTFRGEFYIKNGNETKPHSSHSSTIIEEHIQLLDAVSDPPVIVQPNKSYFSPFFMPLDETLTLRIPATSTVMQKPHVALIRYAVIATVWDTDVDEKSFVESKPLPVVIERHNPELLENIRIYPSRIHEFTGNCGPTWFMIKVPKVSVPNARLEFTYWFQSSTGNPNHVNSSPPQQFKLTLSEEIVLNLRGYPASDSITFKRKIQPAVLDSDRLISKGWSSPAKVGIRLPPWTATKDPETLTSLLKGFRPEDPHNKILDYLNGTLNTSTVPSEYCNYIQINHFVDLILTFTNQTFKETIPITIVPARKSGVLSNTFESMFRTYGGIGANYADQPPPEVPEQFQEELLLYEDIINASVGEYPPDFAEIEGASNDLGILPARISCEGLSPSYTLQTLPQELARRMGSSTVQIIE